MASNKIPCPCCGKRAVEEYEICSECGWEHDDVQVDDPDYRGGANRLSLNEAKANYEATGWSDPEFPKR
jgi:hypothetical protein